MINGKTVLAIVPARQGSRRCPDKNITLYRGRTLMEWAVLHAQWSEYSDTICISSDSDEILKYAIPPIIRIKRPAHLSTDIASSESVIVHALYSCNTLGENIVPFHDIFVLLQPTSPLRTPNDIDSCLELAVKDIMFGGMDTISTVASTDEARKLNGAVYVSQTLRFLSKLDLDAHTFYKMPNSRSLDINYPEDFASEFITKSAWEPPALNTEITRVKLRKP